MCLYMTINISLEMVYMRARALHARALIHFKQVSLALLCGEQLLVVINDILDHSRLEENKVSFNATLVRCVRADVIGMCVQVNLEVAPFSLHEAVEEALEIVSLAAHRKGIELLCEITPGTQDMVAGGMFPRACASGTS